LDAWALGKDTAIRAILDLAESSEAENQLRLYDMTEAQFVSLPRSMQATLRTNMEEQLRALRYLAGELIIQAMKARDVGDRDGALKFLRAAKMLGAANRGPNVPLLADLCGKSIEEQAEKALGALKE